MATIVVGVSASTAEASFFSRRERSLAPPASQEGTSPASAQDSVLISEEARRKAEEERKAAEDQPAPGDLSEEEQQEVERLKQRDREVRQHEQAHLAAAGQYAQGGTQYSLTRGPDGRQYATGGEVSIDTSPASTPEATIQKARVVRRAALAPPQPSAQDRQVAAAAGQLELEARQELAAQQQQKTQEGEPAAAQPEAFAGATDEARGRKAYSETTNAPPPNAPRLDTAV